MLNKCQLVRDTCSWVVDRAQHVRIDTSKFEAIAQFKYVQFNAFEFHNLTEADDELYLNFLFCLDSLNFCFWPNPAIEYDSLAKSVKEATINGLLSPSALCKIDMQTVSNHLFKGIDMPLVDERTRILREVGTVVCFEFNGRFSNIISRANKSAVKLLSILTQHFPNFQDHAIYQGHQIHFYKRAQILIGDMWAHFEGKGMGQFTDIEQLTMFADYRVPQSLKHWGVLVYSQQLENFINSKAEMPHGSQYEVEIRACTVIAVEKLKRYISQKMQKKLVSIEVDWFLWEYGQSNLKSLPAHHRVLSIYY